MCTLMEKDVLIELVAYAQACLSKRVEPDEPLSEDEKRLGEIRHLVYASQPEELNFKELADEIKAIEERHKNEPIRPRYL